MIWRVSNGRIVRFWKDNWVSIHDKLDQYRRGQISHGENILVCFYANAKGNWDLEWIVVDLLANVVESIKMLKSPSMVSKTNYLEWNNVVDSGLSVKKMLISNCLILIHFKNLCCLKTLCVKMAWKRLDFIYGDLVLECCPWISWDFGNI